MTLVDDTNEELDRFLRTRKAWVSPGGDLRASVSYDTIELIIRNLTGRFDHVRNDRVSPVL